MNQEQLQKFYEFCLLEPVHYPKFLQAWEEQRPKYRYLAAYYQNEMLIPTSGWLMLSMISYPESEESDRPSLLSESPYWLLDQWFRFLLDYENNLIINQIENNQWFLIAISPRTSSYETIFCTGTFLETSDSSIFTNTSSFLGSQLGDIYNYDANPGIKQLVPVRKVNNTYQLITGEDIDIVSEITGPDGHNKNVYLAPLGRVPDPSSALEIDLLKVS